MGLVEQIYNRARRRYGDSAGSSHPAKLLQDELRESLMVSGQRSPPPFPALPCSLFVRGALDCHWAQVEGFEQWKYTIEKVESETLNDGPAGIAVVHRGVKPRSKI